MLEIILLIVGIFKAVQRPKLSRLTVQDFPDVELAKFTAWHQAQLKATDFFIWATWGAFFIKLFISLAASGMRPSPEVAITVFVVIVGGWIVGLIVASVYSSKATKLRLAAGINWPKQVGSK